MQNFKLQHGDSWPSVRPSNLGILTSQPNKFIWNFSDTYMFENFFQFWFLLEISEIICRAFIDSGVNGKKLIELTKDDLKNFKVQTEGMRRQIYSLIQMLKHKFGIHEAFTEPLPNFPEAIENFNFLILSPIKKIREKHIRMWIPGYNRPRGKRVKWHMEV